MESDLGVYRVTTSKVDQVLSRQHFEVPSGLPVKSVKLTDRLVVVVYNDESYVVFWAVRREDYEFGDAVEVLPTPAPLHLLSDAELITGEDVMEQIRLEARHFETESEKREVENLKRLLLKHGNKLNGQLNPVPVATTEIRIDDWAHDAQLTVSEREILNALISAQGKPVRYDVLLNAICAHSGSRDRDLATLHVHKCRLTKKLKPSARIVIARGYGYALTRMEV